MTRTLATVVSVDENRRPTILLDGCAEGGEVAALRASGYNPQPGDRCVVSKLGMRFIAEYAVDGPLSAGLSAYEVAVENGFSGTEAQWLASLVGPAGTNGQNGQNGQNGASAYQVAVAGGFSGTEAEWLASLKGEDGAPGVMQTTPSRFPPILVDFLNAAEVAPLAGAAANSGTTGPVDAELNHPGIVYLRPSTSTNSGYAYYAPINCLLLGGGEAFELVFKVVQTASTTCRFGLHDGAGGDPTDGVWFHITDTTLKGKTRSNSVESETNAYTITQGTWYRCKLTVNNGATSVLFQLYSEAGSLLWSGTLTTNIPKNSGRNVGIYAIATSTSGATNIIVWLDWLGFTIDRDLVR